MRMDVEAGVMDRGTAAGLGAGEIRSLTGLRGLAAIFVVVFHEAGNFGGAGPAETFLRHGYNAVDLFFVLSGFVMALTYGETFRSAFSTKDYLGFLEKRIARIYPLYIITTLFTFWIFALHLSHLEPVSHPIYTLTANALMIQAWGLAPTIVGPAWSISAEWGAYLIFPGLAVLALDKKPWRPALLLALAMIALLTLEFGPPGLVLGRQTARLGPLDLYGIETAAPLLRCLASFSLGLIAFRFRAYVSSGWSVPVFIAMVGVLMAPSTDLIFVLLCAILVPSLATDQGRLAAVLGSAPVFSLGVWSYSIYILHARFNPVRVAAERVLTHLHCPASANLAIAISTALVILCAAITYRLIEKPSRNALRQAFQIRRGGSMRTEPAL